MFLIGGQRGDDNVDVVAKALGEHRAQGAICEAAEQDGLFAGASFAFEKAAGDFACGVEAFFVINCEREKIHAGAWLIRAGRRGEDYRVAVPNRHCTVGLPGKFAGFDDQRIIAERNRKGVNVVHLTSLGQLNSSLVG